MGTSAGHRPLSADDLKSFHERGYLLYRDQVFDEGDLAELEAIFQEHRAKEREKRGDEFDTPHFQDQRLLEFLLAPALLDLVECIVGPNIVLWSSHFICKDPLIGRATPWHEDSSYWNGRISTMAGICTVWLAMDRATPENGSMAVIPGTHANGFSEYKPVDASANIFSSEIVDVDENKAVYFELEPNEASLHEGRIIHGAKANTSEFRRAGYTMRYFPTTSKVFPERNQGHKIWLARGGDVAGNTFENV